MVMPNTVYQLLDENPASWIQKTIQPGDFLYQPSDADSYVYWVEKGLIKIGSLGDLGQRVLYDLLKPGELFGDLDYLDEVTFFEYAQAATSASIIAIDRSTFRQATTHSPAMAEWFSELIIRRWHRAETRLLHRNGLAVNHRIQHLQAQYDSLIMDANDQWQRPFDYLSYQEVGDLVGATRQTVSRKLQTSSETYS